jgi:nucleotide-binding universal stress UspA family protein
MFKSIVWATDGSKAADAALPFVRDLAVGAKVTVVHVDQHFMGRAGGYSVLADEPEVRTKIRRQAEELVETGIDATFETRVAASQTAAEVIATAAREANADLIVIGTRGHGPVTGAILGSVTQHLLHDAPCPVLAVPVHAAVPAVV